MGDTGYIIIGVVVAIIIIVIVAKVKKAAKTPWTWEQCEEFVDDLINDGDMKECLREYELMKFKKEAGTDDAMTDEEMEDYLTDLLNDGEITQEEYDECLEIYIDVKFAGNPEGYSF